MADELKDLQTKEVESEKVETKSEDKPFYTKIPETISKILNKIKGSNDSNVSALEYSEEVEDTETQEAKELDVKDGDKVVSKVGESLDSASVEDKSVEEEIPYHLVQAARQFGWSDDRIVRAAEFDVKILEDLYQDSQKDSQNYHKELKKDVKTEEPTSKLIVDDTALKDLRENYGDAVVDKVIMPLIQGNNELSARVDKMQEFQQSKERENIQAEAVRVFNNFNETLDKMAKDYPEFNTYAEMPKDSRGILLSTAPGYKERSQVYDVMAMFIKNGYPEQKAIEHAITWYAGTQGDKRAERKVVTELNEHQKKFTPKPTAKKVKRTFRNTDEAKSNIIQEAKEKAGIK